MCPVIDFVALIAMSENVGLGGHNGAVIFKRYDGD